ncbi:MAG: AAA family ATPase [Candidatus Hydrothermarchaeales archaeon]
MCEVLDPGEYFKVKEPKLSWEAIAGFKEVKERLEELVSLPLKYPETFKKAGVKPHIGVLMWGPSNSGFGALGEAAAESAGCNYISAKAMDLMGDNEHISTLYEKASELAPCVVFIGDIEILAPRREVETADEKWASSVITRLLFSEIDKIAKREDVITLGATQRPELLDPALLRNGRIDRKVYVPAPDYYDRIEIFKLSLKNMPICEDVSLEKLAEMTESYSSGDLLSLVREAALLAIKDKGDDFQEVALTHFKDAVKKVPPALDPAVVKHHEEIFREECKHRYMY